MRSFLARVSWPFCAMASLACLPAGSFGFTVAAERPATIVIPDKPASDTRAAATLLQTLSQKAFGQPWKVTGESASAKVQGPKVMLGRTAATQGSVDARLDTLGPDGIAIIAQGDTLILAGNTPFADESAVTEFARKHMHVEWYMPSDLWTVMPAMDHLEVPDSEFFQRPTFIARQSSGLGNRTNTQANFAWYRMQRANPRYRFHHSPAQMFPPEKFAKTPEVYSLVGGKRKVPGKGSLEGWQVCMTNPLVVETYIKAGEALAKAGPDAPLSISVSPNDGRDFCECENCAKFIDNTLPDESRATALVFQLVNKVAKGLQKTAPNVLVGVMSYSDYRLPVAGLKVEPNVVLYLVGYRADASRVPQGKPAGYDPRIEMWEKAGVKHFGIYEWHHGSVYNVPPIYLHQLANSLKFAAAHGADGLYTESYPSWGLQGPAHWVVSRLAWDVSQDVDTLLEQYCQALFGPAASSMRGYFDLCEKQWTAAGLNWSSPEQYIAFPKPVREKLQAMLDSAAASVKDDDILSQRVAFFNKAFGFSTRMCNAYEQGVTASALLDKGDAAGALLALADPSPDADPIVYMKNVCDPLPLMLYNKSDDLNIYVLSAIKRKLETKIQIAKPIITQSGQALLASGHPTPEAFGPLVEKQVQALLPPHTSGDQARSAAKSIAEYASRAFFASHVKTPPTIDGDLSDEAWASLSPSATFYAYGGGVPAAYETRFKILAHEDRLYLAATCYQDMSHPKAGGATRDSNVWLDDAVEIFINKPGESHPENYVQVIANINGVLYDAWKKDAKWNPDIKVATQRHEDHWTLEMSIPLADTGLSPRDIQGYRLNVVRDVWGPGSGKPAQISAWFPTTFGHGDLDLRGWLFFTNPSDTSSAGK